tara:strand:+ start:434 stop:580 length:147 start_codon:yes stop_codon:yes gene_type:complete
MSYKIDCLKNGSPYAIEIKELKYLYKKKYLKKIYIIFLDMKRIDITLR